MANYLSVFINLSDACDGFLNHVWRHNPTTKLIFMLIELVALLHYFVHVYFILWGDDRLAANRTSVVVICPAQQTLNMKDMVDIALEGHYRIAILEIHQADWAFLWGSAAGLMTVSSCHALLVLADPAVVSFQFEKDSSHSHWVDA